MHPAVGRRGGWCPPCRAEYSHFKSAGVPEEYREKGVVFLGSLFENNAQNPADYATGKRWAKQYDVGFPFVIDPTHQAAKFADTGSSPFNFILDARDMTMIRTLTGFGPPQTPGGKSSTEIALDSLLRDR